MANRAKPTVSNYRGTSTLLNETKNIQLYRVSDETKLKVSRETSYIADEMRRHNLQSRSRFRREENERLRRNEESRVEMQERWREKTKSNPLAMNLVKEEEDRAIRVTERNRVRKLQEQKINLIKSMKGGSIEFDHGFNSVLEKIGAEDMKLLLTLKKSAVNDKAIRSEQNMIESMLASELQQITQQFPRAVPVALKAAAAARESKYSKADFNDRSRLRASGKHMIMKRTQTGGHLSLVLDNDDVSYGNNAATSATAGCGLKNYNYREQRSSHSAESSSSSSINAAVTRAVATAGAVTDRPMQRGEFDSRASGRGINSSQNLSRLDHYNQQQEQEMEVYLLQQTLDEESSSITNSDYKAPTVRLKQFEEDLDKEFSVL